MLYYKPHEAKLVKFKNFRDYATSQKDDPSWEDLVSREISGKLEVQSFGENTMPFGIQAEEGYLFACEAVDGAFIDKQDVLIIGNSTYVVKESPQINDVTIYASHAVILLEKQDGLFEKLYRNM